MAEFASAVDDRIEGSPLLRLPVEQRKEMLANNDQRILDFILLALEDYQRGKKSLDEIEDPDDFGAAQNDVAMYYAALMKAVVRYIPEKSTANGFRAYVGVIFRNEQKAYYATRARETGGSMRALSKTDNRTFKLILEFAQDCGVDEAALRANKGLQQAVADVLKIPAKKVACILDAREKMMYLDAQASDALEGRLNDSVSAQTSVATEVEQKLMPEELDVMAMIISLLALAAKEKQSKKYGLWWSNLLLEYMRGNETKRGNNRKTAHATSEPRRQTDEQRLACCDALAPLEQKNCLWDVLLLPAYVEYLIAQPLPARELPPVALNPLVNPDNPPGNKALAQYIGRSTTRVSQITKEFQAYYSALRAELARVAEEN